MAMISFLLFFSTFLVVPAQSTEVLTLPCGTNGETYKVILPAGIAISGTQCTGPLEIDSRVKIIDQQAFRSIYLNSVVIPNSVTIIGRAAFEGSKLSEVVIPNSVKSIGSHAFSSIGNLISVKLPDSPVELDYSVFANSGIETVIIPNSFSKLSSGMFQDTNLKSISIPTSVNTIESGALSNTKLTSLVIPNSIVEIQNRAFEGNLYLTTISLPDSLRVIGDNAFDRNYSLTSILYCGNLTGFPIKPICPSNRESLTDKAAADKAAADKAAADKAAEVIKFEGLMKRINNLKIRYPNNSQLAGMEVKAKVLSGVLGKNLGSTIPSIEKINQWLDSNEKVWAYTQKQSKVCTKGKLTKKVTGVSPKCPAGYKLK